QAAAAEHGAIRRALPTDDDGEGEAGRLSRFRRTISENRRPILLAVGAVVLAIAAFQFAKPLFGSSDGAESTAPIVTAAANTDAPPVVAATPLPVDAIAGGEDPEVLEAPPVSPATANVSPGAAAFIPPDGVTSPLNPQTAIAPAADAGTYAMPDEAIGAVRLRVAAAQGDPAALYEVGARYADGLGVARDLAEAAIWLERAAEAGLAVAQHRLAAMYEAGLGVPEDRSTALQWYGTAAEQGNILAMHNVGVMFSQGIDGPPDFVAAVSWFASAADHGIRDSQYNLGVIYARGIGVEPNLTEAYKWFAIAAAHGDSDAAARRDDVAAALTPEQLTAARASVTVWTVQSAPAAANTVEAPEGGWDVPEERVDAGDRGELVRTIQALLADHGFDPGPADGVEGPKTRDAARAFQQAIGVQPTGVVDEFLLSALANQAA
ncbi:MAG: peptidoglycan-binding protein, partial [Alphaproteobacteria bacterium]